MPGTQSVLQFIPVVFSGIEVKAFCMLLEFYASKSWQNISSQSSLCAQGNCQAGTCLGSLAPVKEKCDAPVYYKRRSRQSCTFIFMRRTSCVSIHRFLYVTICKSCIYTYTVNNSVVSGKVGYAWLLFISLLVHEQCYSSYQFDMYCTGCRHTRLFKDLMVCWSTMSCGIKVITNLRYSFAK